VIPRSRLPRVGVSALVSAAVLVSTATSPAPVHAAPGADMVVTKEASVSEVPVDGLITYTITARNAGTARAENVRVRDTRIDRELIIISGPTMTGGLSCRKTATNDILCNKRRFEPGASATVTFTARAPVEACVLVRNRAETEAANEPAANTTNNVSNFVSVRMTGCPPDTTPPTGSVLINRGQPIVWGPKVLLSLNVSDDRTGDKSILMRLSNSSEASAGRLVHAVGEAYVPARRWSLISPDKGGTGATGQKSVFAQFRDRAGNWSPVFSDSIEMRSDAPNSCAVAAPGPRRALDVTFRETIYPRRDVDWFKFRLSSRRAVVISVGQLPANFSLALAGSRCGILVRSDRLGTAPEVIRRTLGPGLYFVRVRGARITTESVRPYTIRFDTRR
jgi:uncharacterized repeat protein (TIGR01451 family)